MSKYITNLECYVQQDCRKYKSHTCINTFCPRLYKIDTLYNNALLTKDQKLDVDISLEPKDMSVYQQLEYHAAYIQDLIKSGSNLYLYSETPGNGKTSWAIKLLQRYIRSVWHKANLTCIALFINVPKYTRELKLNIDNRSDYITHINKYVQDADIVVWDDVAIKESSNYEHEQLITILDNRINNHKCNIFTSNVNPESLVNLVGTRLSSRILGNSVQLHFQGNDKRTTNKKGEWQS